MLSEEEMDYFYSSYRTIDFNKLIGKKNSDYFNLINEFYNEKCRTKPYHVADITPDGDYIHKVHDDYDIDWIEWSYNQHIKFEKGDSDDYRIVQSMIHGSTDHTGF